MQKNDILHKLLELVLLYVLKYMCRGSLSEIIMQF